MGSPPRRLSADYFDGWYADMARSPAKDELMRRHLGLPADMLSSSLLTWDGVADVVTALHLAPGDVLLDLACGRGGYGLAIADRTRARLVGVDFSAEAVRQARLLGPAADFRTGDLVATGLDPRSVDAVVCVDAVQFAEPPEDFFAEVRRILRPGGRVVLTCWEPLDAGDERLPARLRGMDLRGGLTAAGFADVVVEERPDWRACEKALWEEVAALDPLHDAALRSLHDEGVAALQTFDLLRRVMATATAPAAPGLPAR